ncbi:MAG: GNAT family N-acetyltransferase [Acidobacteriota bacterium]
MIPSALDADLRPPIEAVQEIETVEGLAALKEEWAALWERCPSATPFQRPEWLLPWCRHFGPLDLWALAVRVGDRLVGLAPFFVYERPKDLDAGGYVEERVLALVGTGNSDYLDILVEPAHRDGATAAITSHLESHAWRWDVGVLEQLRDGSPLREMVLPEVWSDSLKPQTACPAISLPDRPEALREAVPPKQLKCLQRLRRRAAEIAPLRFVAADESNREEIFQALVALHGSRWQGQGQTGVLDSEEIQGFHREVIAGFASLGVPVLHGLFLGDALIAAFYGFFDRGATYYYLHGFDAGWKHLSPGLLLVGAALDEAIARGMRTFDFLRGQETYKYYWGARDRMSFARRFRPAAQRAPSSSS